VKKIAEIFENREDVLRFCVEASLVLVLAFLCSQIVWTVVTPSGVVVPAYNSSVVNASTNATLTTGVDKLSVLTTSNPFLSPERGNASISEAALVAPETSLNLELKGVRANGNGAGVAFILLPDNRQIRAGVGAEILDDVELRHVLEDRVTLLTRGELETLYLRDPDGPGGELGSSAIRSVSAAAARTGEVSASRFLQDVSFTLVRQNGTRTGYRLTPKSDVTSLTSAGFEPEDIVRSVNASPVSEIDSEDLQELLLRTGVIKFDVERAGETVRVSVRFF
jgi:general secretion pathway protein C